MQNLFYQVRQTIGDNTTLLALITAIVMLVLYVGIRQAILLIICIPYSIIAAIGIYKHYTDVMVDDESTEDLLSHTNIPTAHLNTITTSMSVTVDGLVRASHAINDVTAQQSSSATEQVEVISQANIMLETFLELSESVSEQVRAITQVAQETAEISEDGQVSLEQTLYSMHDIRTQVEAIGKTIITLATYTRRIDDIITSVSEIATQSNLLALNASIEAARAGTAGRGFAVVADEVRDLARESTEAAAAIRRILNEIKSAMKDSVQATQFGIKNVEAGVQKTQEANQVIVQLADNVRTSRDAVSEIYTLVRKQAEGIEDISINMGRMQLITQQNVATIRTVESVSANLNRLASDLQVSVNPQDAPSP